VPYTGGVLQPGQFERRIASVGTAGLAAVLLFFATLAYWQVFRTDLEDDDRNPRVLREFSNPDRGRILDRDGNVLALSNADGSRRYTDASVAHLVGYIDPRYGSQGAELVFNGTLSGKAPSGWQGALDREFGRGGPAGRDVRLTIDGKVQAAAAHALGARRGAVVALNPKTGEVLAMVSVPTYDPGALAAHGEALLSDASSPLLNRATQGKYPPGSTFKVVTAASALENRVMTPETSVTCPGEIVIEGFPISCQNTAGGVGTYPFKEAFWRSVNAIFGEVGVELGWDRLEDTARRFGFEEPLPFTLDTAAAELTRAGTPRTRALLASTAFGQGELLATPLQMAVVAAAIGNGGVLVEPRLGLPAAGEGPLGSRRVVAADIAATLRDFMIAVVTNKQASGVDITGVKVGGKTGTAETGNPGVSHAWFIAFAPAEDPVVAVAVIVEEGGRGGEVAAPIAGQVIRTALRR
jgi:peptidoglycan glycosyltransferase